ncbi:hypothetical protein GGQ18_002741 [Salinibacter ruber]|jgi:hypothetical protein|uniref:hypothetical protein n=1 Tax=Salinibacter ruber TaxID=146919 RepID=UPI00161023AF|nr:hypothetical protein [Salinibacter ruber]MBB4070133.1 hypothetical protein [Salinibacter ruber]
MTTRSAPRLLVAFVAFTLLCLALPDSAHAYGGPGSVISGIGALLAAIAALLASLFGFIWFPLKRLLQSTTDEEAEQAAPAASPSDADPSAE